LKRDLKNAGGNVFDDGFWRAREIAQQIAGFGDDGFASDQRRIDCLDRFGTRLMKLFTAVQQGYDDTGIEKCGLHRPKFRKCFLLEPRSDTLERNIPRPMTPRFFLRKRLASKIRNPSLTTCEGVQPSSRTSAASVFRD
jgi:hypothetical protein